MNRGERAGRGWAYTGASLGGAVSIAANVAHSYVPPVGASAGWRPEPGAVIGAVFWPVALFVVVEIVARTAWPAGRRWVALRYAGLLPVAAVAALVSYRHLSGLLRFYREDGLTAALGPLAVDGLMLTATAALIGAGRVLPALAVDAGDQPAPAAGPVEAGEAGPLVHTPPVRDDEPLTSTGGPASDPPQPAADPLLGVARQAAADLADAGRPVSRTSLAAGIRAAGQPVGSARAADLLRVLAEQNGHRS